MATTIDTLVTKFILDDQYTTKASTVSQATQGIAAHATQATKSVQGLTQSLAGVAGSIPGLGGVANAVQGIVSSLSGLASAGAEGGVSVAGGLGIIAEVAAAVVAAIVAAEVALAHFAAESYKVFAKFDTLRRMFTGFLGDEKKSEQMFKYLEGFSVGKPFQIDELGGAALQLTQLQVSVNKYLPVLTQLATAFKRPDESYGSSLQSKTSILERVESGESGLAFSPRLLLAAGIPKKVLMQLGQGLFDSLGEFKGSTDQALELLVKLAEKEKGISKSVQGGAEAMIADFDDAKKKLQNAFASGFAPLVANVIRSITASITEVKESGNAKAFGQELQAIFAFDPSDMGLTEGLIQVEAMFIRISVTSLNLAESLRDLFDALTGGGLGAIAQRLGAISSFFSDLFSGKLGNLKKDIEEWKDSFNPEKIKARRADPNNAWDNYYGNTKAQEFLDAEHARINAYRAKGKKSDGYPDAPDTGSDAAAQMGQQTNLLAKIAFYTGQTAAHLERHAFGGGDLGRYGYTVAERAGKSSGAGNSSLSHGAQARLGAAIELAVSEMISSAIGGNMRFGFVNSGRG